MLERIKNKNAQFIQENLGWLLLGLAGLVIILVGYTILTGKGTGLIAQIKNLFRFG
ncbi:MAG: hypothetical protein AABW67_03600 [Nanoarchaeota archaeon]